MFVLLPWKDYGSGTGMYMKNCERLFGFNMCSDIFFIVLGRYDEEEDMFVKRSAGKLSSNVDKIRVSGRRDL